MSGWHIPLPEHEQNLFPQRGHKIMNIKEERTSIEVRRKRQYPHTQYPIRNPIRSPEPPGKTKIIKT